MDRITVLFNHIAKQPRLQDIGSQKTNMAAGPLTTHVLDTALGKPAAAMPIKLFMLNGSAGWELLASGETNENGRLPGLLPQERFLPATYKMTFDTQTYFSLTSTQGFYPYVDIVFEVRDPQQHYHVPLLISPYGYSTYRGS